MVYIAKFLLPVVMFMGLLPIQAQAQKNTSFMPGEVWKDTDGNPINAHGGGLLYHEGTYYWYGEYKKGKTILPEWATWECYRTDVTGVGCYSSRDLLNWKFEGIVLPAVKDDPNHDLHPSKVLERPKVIYNKKTGKFVMWAHVESADYSKACAGVAVSDSPAGPFTYLGSFRPALSSAAIIARADTGPIPETEIKLRKSCFSSSVAKPYRSSASSLTTW